MAFPRVNALELYHEGGSLALPFPLLPDSVSQVPLALDVRMLQAVSPGSELPGNRLGLILLYY
jgi:hypothetical protein